MSTVKQNFKIEIYRLFIQIFWDRLAVLPLGYTISFIFKYILKYKIKNLEEIRAEYKKLSNTADPILICPNHLTMIDSNIIIWALAPMLWYQFNFKKLSWNVPAVENFKNTLTRRFVTYLGKCIPVDRNGSKEHHDMVLQKTIYLMNKGEVFTYFPEGGRSRTARIDMENIRYGVGKLVAEIPKTRVICIYMRGEGQKTYTEIPQKGEKFTIKLKMIYPKTEYTGLRAHRDISTQIIQTLKNMEDDYFKEFPDVG